MKRKDKAICPPAVKKPRTMVVSKGKPKVPSSFLGEPPLMLQQVASSSSSPSPPRPTPPSGGPLGPHHRVKMCSFQKSSRVSVLVLDGDDTTTMGAVDDTSGVAVDVSGVGAVGDTSVESAMPTASTLVDTAAEVVLPTMNVVVYTDVATPTADVVMSGSPASPAAPVSASGALVEAQSTAEPVMEEATDADPSSVEPMDTGDAEVPHVLDDVQREVEEWRDELSRLGRAANRVLNRLVGRTNMPCLADNTDLGALNA